MSDQPSLSEALARSQQRAAMSNEPPPGMNERAVLAIVRTLALIHGLDPDTVETSFQKGGPLADLVRLVLGAEQVAPTAPRGRPRQNAKSWTAFVSVVQLMRTGLSQEQAIGRIAAETGTPEATIRDRFTRTRDRDGISPDSVPTGSISAYFSDPRQIGPTAKR